MTRALLLGFAASFVAGTSCAPVRLPEDDCVGACKVAARCGILPSTLGGAIGDGEDELAADCEERCLATDATDPGGEGESILECLLEHLGSDVCAVDACEAVFDCFRTFPAAVVGQREVTMRLIDGDAWMQLFAPGVCEALPAPTDPAAAGDWVCDTEDDPCPGLSGAPVDRPPLCFGDGCDDPQSCDPRLCDLDVPPALDCAQLGVETVQFGYFDRHGGLHLDAARYSCTEAAGGRVIADVKDVVIYPIALFTGTLTSRVLGILDAPASAAGRPYCWLSHPSDPPEVGWLVRSGGNLIAVPSPSSAALAAELAGDPTLFPRGCACLLDNIGCEDADENMNCDNGIDDDQDGLVDAEDPGCGA